MIDYGPHHFRAEIEILFRPPGSPVKYNGIRWSFVYQEDLDALGPAKAPHSDVWPIFHDAEGRQIPVGVPLQGTLAATMHIMFRQMEDYHLGRLRVGSQFCCMEAISVHALGRVTAIGPG